MSYGDYQPTEQELADIASELILKAEFVGECLICHLEPNFKGYCYVSVGGRNGVRIRAHRLVWVAANGPIPDDLFVLHKCDNRRCILDGHLFLGTAHDNTQDMMNKGRHKFEPRKPDPNRREAALALQQEGLNRFEIAEKLLVSPSTVWNYLRGPYSHE